MPDIDFGSLGQQATALVNESNAAPTTGATTTSVQAPADQSALSQQQSTQPAGVQPPTGSEQSAITPPATPSGQPSQAEPTYDVDLGNGRIEKLTQSQIRDLHGSGLRQADYTKKTQELAQHRQIVEQAAERLQLQMQQFEAVQRLQSNPELAKQFLQQQQQAADPNRPVTAADLQQFQQQLVQQQQALQQGAQAYVENRLQVANMAESINATLNEVYKETPALKQLPELEDVMRYRVAQLNPQSLEEAQQAFKNVAKDLASSLGISAVNRQQQQQQASQQLAATGTQPPGGAAVGQQKPNFYNKGKRDIDWKALAGAATQV